MAYGAYRILTGAGNGPVILHVPHSSWTIPPDVRAGLLLTDEELDAELRLLTDANTDRIAQGAATAAHTTPWSFVNQLSRLVVDPERLPDEREEMLHVGMGAVYTRTSHGRPLRAPDAAAEQSLLTTWYEPYRQAMTGLADARLDAVGRVTIIDVHSYPCTRLPYERGGDKRPAVCLGTDSFHTPDWLLIAACDAFHDYGTLATDSPFAGCYVPLVHYRSDPRVTAIMVELRRDTYMTEPGGEPTEGIEAAVASLASLIDRVTVHG
jgi:N-formylglutamate deformylase